MNNIQLSEAFKCLEDVDDKIFEDIKAPKLLKEGYVKRSEGKCLCSFDEENWEECSEEEFIELKDGGYEDLTEDEPEPKKVTESIKIDIRDDNQVSLARKLINMKKELEADSPEEVVDLKASTDEEAQETSHEGQIKLTCKTCGTSIFLKQDEVEFDLKDPETVNKEFKECPYCHNSNGWEIEGKVVENDGKSEEEPGENDEIDSDLDELSDENLDDKPELDKDEDELDADEESEEIDLSESIQQHSSLVLSDDGKEIIRQDWYEDLFGHIDIPDGVEIIPDRCFEYSINITSVHLPDSVKRIGRSAFRECGRLQSINIPTGVTRIKNQSFAVCTALRSIDLPDSINHIGWSAFADCESLKSINLPDSAEEIEIGAFAGCISLAKINLPKSLKKIEAFTFANCESLTSITIPDSVEEIGEEAFKSSLNLKSIDLPSSLLEIGKGAFAGCISLAKINLPKSLKKIKAQAFKHCESLTSITIPDSVNFTGAKIFQRCTKLKTINCNTAAVYSNLLDQQEKNNLPETVKINLNRTFIDISEDIEISKFDEKRFDNMINQYLNEVYDNIDSYRTTDGIVDDESNKILIEGIIKFKSGKETDTKFLFEAKNIDINGCIKFVGLNESFSKSKSAFSLQGAVINNQLFCTRLDYDYRPLITSLNESAKDSMIRVTGKIAYKRK